MAPRPPEPSDADYVIVVGGPVDERTSSAPSPVSSRDLAPTSVVVAADSGIDLACAYGLGVDHLVGDLDSASAAGIVAARRAGTEVHRHPADKDATDFELAVDLVIDLAGRRRDHAGGWVPALLVLGPGGGRLDHLLADVVLLGAAKLAPFEVTAAFGPALVLVVRPDRPRTLPAGPGAQVSILPLTAPAVGVSTTGLRWPLADAHLEAGTTRAVSNEVTATATVSLTRGVLAVVIPGGAATPVTPRTTPYDPTPRNSR